MFESILSTRAVADLFGVKPRTVLRWVAAGRLSPIGHNGRLGHLFDEDTVKNLMEKLNVPDLASDLEVGLDQAEAR